ILSALLKLGSATAPPLEAGLDAEDQQIRAELIEVLLKRGETSAIPYLWYLSASPAQSPRVRAAAAQALAAFLDTTAARLRPAKQALTEEAERYYQHQKAFRESDRVVVWRWQNKGLVSQIMTASQAEEYYGLRFARQALELDPTYPPAQLVFLSLA